MFDNYDVVRLLQEISGKLDTVLSYLKNVSSNSSTISVKATDSLTVFQNIHTAITQFFGKFDFSVLYAALAVIVLCCIVNSFLKRGWLN